MLIPAILKKQQQRAKSGTSLHLKDRGLGTFDHTRAQVFPSNSHASQKQRGHQLSFVYDLIYIQRIKHIPHTEHLHMLHVFCSTWVAFSSPSPYLSPHYSPTQLPSLYSTRVISEGLHIPVLRGVGALLIVKY